MPMFDDYFMDENNIPLNKYGIDIVKLLLSKIENKNTKEFLYDTADVKILLKISDKTLYRMRKNRAIPFFKIGKKIYYPQWFFSNFNNKHD